MVRINIQVLNKGIVRKLSRCRVMGGVQKGEQKKLHPAIYRCCGITEQYSYYYFDYWGNKLIRFEGKSKYILEYFQSLFIWDINLNLLSLVQTWGTWLRSCNYIIYKYSYYFYRNSFIFQNNLVYIIMCPKIISFLLNFYIILIESCGHAF